MSGQAPFWPSGLLHWLLGCLLDLSLVGRLPVACAHWPLSRVRRLGVVSAEGCVTDQGRVVGKLVSDWQVTSDSLLRGFAFLRGTL